MAKDLGKNQTTIKKVMRKLEDVGLLEKKRQGFCMPNILYIKIPQEVQETCLSERSEIMRTFGVHFPVLQIMIGTGLQ